MNTFCEFQEAWAQCFPGCELPQVWAEDITTANLIKHRQKLAALKEELEKVEFYVQHLENLVTRYAETSSSQTVVIKSEENCETDYVLFNESYDSHQECISVVSSHKRVAGCSLNTQNSVVAKSPEYTASMRTDHLHKDQKGVLSKIIHRESAADFAKEDTYLGGSFCYHKVELEDVDDYSEKKENETSENSDDIIEGDSDKLVKSVDMSKITASDLTSSVDDVKYNCQVILCDIFAGIKRKKDQEEQFLPKMPSSSVAASIPDLGKRKLMQQQLVLLQHVQNCEEPEDQSSGDVRRCSVPRCRIMKLVLIHMQTCSSEKCCPVPYCSLSRQIISHLENCTSSDCPLCSPGINKACGSSALPHKSKILQDFKSLFLKKENCDVILRVKGQEFPAHKAILIARSPVFASMFQNDMKEKQTGIVDIEDCDPSSFSDFLCFLYCEELNNVSEENVYSLFIAADKYDVPDLREKCIEFMKENVSIDTFCEIITFALQHSETELINFTTEFFVKNALKIVRTVKWQSFVTENPVQSNELFIQFATLSENSNV